MAFEVKNLFRSAVAGGHTTWVYTGPLDPGVPVRHFFADLPRGAGGVAEGDLLILPDVSRLVFIYFREGDVVLVPAR